MGSYNRETSAADGTSSVPPPPAPTTPGSCPNPDVLVPCCNGNCHFSGCSATVNLCPNCSAATERLRKEESAAFNAHNTKIDLAAESAATDPRDSPSMEDDKKDAAGVVPARPLMADIADLRTVMKSSGSTSRCKILPTQPSDSCTIQEGRIPSPLSLSPPQQQEVVLSVAPRPQEKAVKRCVACRKRVGLLRFKCRCGDIFCASHRYSDTHDCSYDFKAAGRLAIAKENPVVMASKINKI
ncbi:hypothetical protein GOP47_0011937 [Adiantum capillus-veneris]|uniref:AN1-type domain-containing protein n=1 Tax=Adiantum capillus-veneris TaxID=13818 RepID=A0A9D4UTQ0_ADICA|nr:hypothetical protein GOP47_0011937 [Adiantum capillus-veneris]